MRGVWEWELRDVSHQAQECMQQQQQWPAASMLATCRKQGTRSHSMSYV